MGGPAMLSGENSFKKRITSFLVDIFKKKKTCKMCFLKCWLNFAIFLAMH